MTDLSRLRNRLDEIDDQLVALYKERMDICRQVGELKAGTGKPVYDREREAQKLAAVTKETEDRFLRQGLKELYEQLLTQSRKLQYRILVANETVPPADFQIKERFDFTAKRIVFQGVPGSYSQAATQKFFGPAARTYHVGSFRQAIEEIVGRRADYAVLPIENSSAGMVADVYDLLYEYDTTIIGEVVLPIVHTLAGVAGASLETIRAVYSHPQALMQSSDFLAAHPDWQQISVANTALAAHQIMTAQDVTKAAICSVEAAKLYQLQVILTGINKSEANSTRFIIVSGHKECLNSAGKVSICFELPHETGSLYRLLSHVIFNGLNMTKIESRPVVDRNWEYRFFVDFEGRLTDGAVKNALLGIREESRKLKILGNY